MSGACPSGISGRRDRQRSASGSPGAGDNTREGSEGAPDPDREAGPSRSLFSPDQPAGPKGPASPALCQNGREPLSQPEAHGRWTMSFALLTAIDMLFSYIASNGGEIHLSFAQWSLVTRLMVAAAVAALVWLMLWSVL